VSRKADDEATSDLCVAAFERLANASALPRDQVEAIAVVTQNPDTAIPHTSAIVHGKLGLRDDCATFDISLGCSGFVHGWSILQGFMRENGLTSAVLFTADPYSPIIDPRDKNTALLFGDAATATWLSAQPMLVAKAFSFGTCGKRYADLICTDGALRMNGRGVFQLVAERIPGHIKGLVARQGLELDQIDRFIVHQGSKFIVDTLTRSLGVGADRVPCDLEHYGNTVSSSIPLILERELGNHSSKRMVLSGFGVGLAWASAVVERVEGSAGGR
jgi:3-oxoacyl-[acyl-carrier-protein] synthase-3